MEISNATSVKLTERSLSSSEDLSESEQSNPSGLSFLCCWCIIGPLDARVKPETAMCCPCSNGITSCAFVLLHSPCCCCLPFFICDGVYQKMSPFHFYTLACCFYAIPSALGLRHCNQKKIMNCFCVHQRATIEVTDRVICCIHESGEEVYLTNGIRLW